MEATARLKAKGMKEGGMVVKDKIVAIDKSPNSGLITTKGFKAEEHNELPVGQRTPLTGLVIRRENYSNIGKHGTRKRYTIGKIR